MGISTRGEEGAVLRNRRSDESYRDPCLNTGRNPMGTRIPDTSLAHPHNTRTIDSLPSSL